ncbi:MAG: gephyrin-like molybdotransferase Glp [Pseudomonadota bacterium]
MRARSLIDDCFRIDPAAPLMPHLDVISQLRSRIVPVVDIERAELDHLAGRVLASTIHAGGDVPPHANAAVDGFAFRHADVRSDPPPPLDVVGVAAAGRPFTRGVSERQAVRILTGALVPEDVDTIAMQEDCTTDAASGTVTVPTGLKRRANVRPAGEDLAKGDQLFAAGHVVRVQDIAALASIGCAATDVYQRPRVQIISTGDELVPPGDGPLGLGQVYDANTATLAIAVRNAGGTLTGTHRLPDVRAVVRDTIRQAAGHADLVITSGGASTGSEDHIAPVLDELGSRHLWRINIKPGRPMMFGQIGDTVFVGLPGNPVAAFVCFHLYVWPILRVLGGSPWPEPVRLPLPAAFAVSGRKHGRREYWRGWLETDRATGAVAVQKFPRDGSGLISSIRAADGLIEVPDDAGDVAPGDPVSYIPLSQFMLPRAD